MVENSLECVLGPVEVQSHQPVGSGEKWTGTHPNGKRQCVKRGYVWNDAKYVWEVKTFASADVETRKVREMRNGGSNHVFCQSRATL